METLISKVIQIAKHTDQELLELYLSKEDLKFLGELFSRYSHLAYGVCLKYLNQHDAQDAVMDVFEQLTTLVKKHEIKNFKSWLYSVTKNHCLMKLRKEKGIYKIDEVEELQDNFMESEDELHLIHEKELSLEKLENGIKQLKKEQQECIRLFYLKEKSYEDVSKETGYELKKVKSYIQNGKRNLKIYLEANSIILVSILLDIYFNLILMN